MRHLSKGVLFLAHAIPWLTMGWTCPAHAESKPYPPFYQDPTPFEQAIAGTTTKPIPQFITGLTVPHHLLAVDLIAETLMLAKDGDYDRILIISPDHFRRSTTAAATTKRDFLTVLGRVTTDQAAVQRLLQEPLFSESNLFSHEHGIRAILPLLAAWFPQTPVVSVTVGIRTTPAEWQAMAQSLESIITPKTLVIQSTDFSHYLTPEVAAVKDAETLLMLARGDPEGVKALHQPDHIDSKAAQWIQMTLQQKCGSRLTVVNNRNSAEYATGFVPVETTSYITQVFSREPIFASQLPGSPWFFAGDFHTGRHMAKRIPNENGFLPFQEKIQAITQGAPLVLNLEGVTIPETPPPPDPGTMKIVLEEKSTFEHIKSLGVKVVVTANNHTGDLGHEAYQTMVTRLKEEGFHVAENGSLLSLTEFELLAATDLTNQPEPQTNLLRASLFNGLPPKVKPRVMFFHWGLEYRQQPDKRQNLLATWAEEAGFDLITGCHPHHPSPGWNPDARVFRWDSLGNFLFDQPDPRCGGVLLETRFFAQGTMACRPWPLGNLYRELFWRKTP